MPFNKQNRIDCAKTPCPKCGAIVSNLGKHLRRKRCNRQHIRRINGQKPTKTRLLRPIF